MWQLAICPVSGAGACRRLSAAALVIALVLLASTVPPLRASDGQSPGTIDLDTANRLVDAYFRQVVKRLPRDWRRAEEEKLRDNPPRLGSHGLFQITSPDGQIVLEHDAERASLVCWATIHKVRREYPLIGLTREEILAALKARQAKGASTGGGELVWDSVSDGFFLRREYRQAPELRQMIRELDRLTAAGEKWFRKYYLEAVLSHAETLRPPPSATAESEGFRATLALTPDTRYIDLWDRPPGAVMPQLVTRAEVPSGSTVWLPVFFSGVTAGADGKARVEAELTVLSPDGSVAGWMSEVLLWDAVAPPVDHLQFGLNSPALTFGPEEPPGRYLARMKVCDAVAGRCVALEHPFRVTAPEAEPAD